MNDCADCLPASALRVWGTLPATLRRLRTSPAGFAGLGGRRCVLCAGRTRSSATAGPWQSTTRSPTAT